MTPTAKQVNPRISSSTLSTLKACPHKFNLLYRMGALDDPAEAQARTAGAAFAASVQAVLMARRAGTGRSDSIAIGLRALIEALPRSFDPPRDTPTLCQALVGYFDTWDNDESTVLEIEFTFAGPFPGALDPNGDPYIYESKLDSIVKDPAGLWARDEKTTTRMGTQWAQQWSLRSQFIAYMWSCRQAGYPVQGLIVRGIGFYKTQPPQFLEHRVLHSQYLEDRWLENTAHWLNSLTRYLKSGVFPRAMDDACNAYGGCLFRDSCLARNPDEWLSFTPKEELLT